MYSDGKEILDTNSVILYNNDADLVIEVVASETFSFKLVMIFKNDTSGERHLDVLPGNGELVVTCTNFEAQGAGTKRPFEIATAGGRKIYLQFWVTQEIPEMRKVNYTLFIEKAGEINNE